MQVSVDGRRETCRHRRPRIFRRSRSKKMSKTRTIVAGIALPVAGVLLIATRGVISADHPVGDGESTYRRGSVDRNSATCINAHNRIVARQSA